jgi:hypothetical protein
MVLSLLFCGGCVHDAEQLVEPVPAVISDWVPAEADPAPGPTSTPEDDAPAPLAVDPQPGRHGRLTPNDEPSPLVWGIVGIRGFAFGQQLAPNGLEYNPLFSLDFDFNLWLWQSQGVYLYTDARFWGQKAAPGITNSTQGVFDFSKRELDLTMGSAWNYTGNWEARVFAYSVNNLNRGSSAAAPSGYNDGVGLENRLYLGTAYDALGTADFDVARTPFVSVGYYPTKDLVDGAGTTFKPGPFARASLIYDLFGERCYLYADAQVIGDQNFSVRLLECDAGIAFRPFSSFNRLEFRIGTPNTYDVQAKELETGMYGAVRLIF